MKYCGVMLLIFTFQCLGETITTCLDFPPFEMTEQGNKKWSGANIETLHHVAQAASLDLDTSIRAPFARCLELLKSGQIDILPGLFHTEERASTLLLLPYTLRHELAVFYPKTSHAPLSPEDMLGNKVIGVNRVFALPDTIKAHPISKQLLPVSSVDVGFEMLIKGRLDGLLATIEAGKTALRDKPDYNNKLDFIPLNLASDMRICFGISKTSPLANQIESIQSAIDSVATNPKLNYLNVMPSTFAWK